jgi:hypothetical protein
VNLSQPVYFILVLLPLPAAAAAFALAYHRLRLTIAPGWRIINGRSFRSSLVMVATTVVTFANVTAQTTFTPSRVRIWFNLERSGTMTALMVLIIVVCLIDERHPIHDRG